ncbi:MAG: extracellular solute-binding protein, partial [Halobacteriales archaeon]|nr:extracellular solute-binding protein [Halobacteriales archaeon]
PDEWFEILAAGQEEGVVVVAGFPFLADAMAAQFEADTGIRLEWLGGDGSENSARLEQEARAGNVTIDILLGGGRELQTLLPDGLLQSVKDQMILPSVQDGPWWRDGHRHWYDSAGEFLFQGAGWVFGWVTVNADVIDPSDIRVWDDLLKPEFANQIIAYDPTTNGPGQGATGFMGARRGPEYLEQLYIGQNVEFVRDNGALMEAVARGTKPIGLYGLQSFVERFKAEGFNLEVVLPEDDPGYITSGFSVLKQAVDVPHPNAAQVFINWYATQPAQQVYSEVLLATSNRLDVDNSHLPGYVIPQQGVDYFDDNTEEFYTVERQEYIDQVTELLGGR